LKFTLQGKTHFGWARLNVSCIGYKIRATLTGYAYETIPNKPIITGRTKGPDAISVDKPEATLTMPTREPGSLGLLAVGAPGLSFSRREELVETTR
jgi:hypothetical protein